MTEEGKKFRAAITATARFLPDKVVTNADMERLVDTSDGWIRSRTGISERRFLPADEPTSTMASAVAQELVVRRGIDASDLDLIIVATITPDMIFPATACLVQHAIGASGVLGLRPVGSLLWLCLCRGDWSAIYRKRSAPPGDGHRCRQDEQHPRL